MEKLTLDLTTIANGGAAVARAKRGRTLFVPYGIPGEKVRAEIHTEKGKIAHAHLVEVLRPSPDRIEPRCPHFTVCGGCHFQHMSYQRQLQVKQTIVQDQMERIGHFKETPVAATLANPRPWHYNVQMHLSPVKEGGLGFWSPVERRVIPIETCPITRPELLELRQDVDLDLPGLRKLSLWVGDDEALLAAVEVDGVEPPRLEANFPVSMVIVLPDKTAVNLFGDNFTIQSVQGRDFRVSAGCDFAASPEGMELLVNTVLQQAQLLGRETALELYSGVGALTAFLAEQAAEVVAVEMNPDAVADTAVNLPQADNVSLYEGRVEEALPRLDIKPDVLVMHPPRQGLSREAVKLVVDLRPSRIVYASSDIATFARDGRQLTESGYKLLQIQPVDLRPQTYYVDVVGVWEIGD
ncbi:MAG: class I SAM-dependent RNA methyltransferase [Chloroflexi bacterium]|nr:class I SAM-dependent RNA methyltransferase [Chloroflexota bacterium]